MPLAAIQLHAHAHSLGVRTLGNEAQAAHDDGRVQLSQLTDVRVHVALNDLKQHTRQLHNYDTLSILLTSNTVNVIPLY